MCMHTNMSTNKYVMYFYLFAIYFNNMNELIIFTLSNLHVVEVHDSKVIPSYNIYIYKLTGDIKIT